MSSISTKKAKQKLAQARKGEINLPAIAGIALGDGGEANGELKTPLAENVALFHELIRKPYSACTKISDTSYRYRIDLEAEELAGKVINEMALYDADGDLIAIRTFIGKPKDADIEMAFEFDDIFLGGGLMSYFEEDGSGYDNQIRKIKEDDRATALLLNTLSQSLINNDAFIKSIIEKHLANRENPHDVSKKQLMLENVDNTSDLNKPVSLAVQDAFDAYYEQLAGYTDQAISDLINGAPETLNTLKEVADAIAENKSVQEALDAAIGKKANAEEFDSHTKTMATSTVAGHVKVDTALSSTSTNAIQNKVINAELSKKLDKTGDSKDSTVTFTSADGKEPTSYTDIALLATGEKHSSILNKISTMFKNVRYLYKMLGTTDISAIGNGTVTGGLSELNSNLKTSIQFPFEQIVDNQGYKMNGRNGYNFFYYKVGNLAIVMLNILCLKPVDNNPIIIARILATPICEIIGCACSSQTADTSALTASMDTYGNIKVFGGTAGKYYYGTLVFPFR